MSTPHKEKIIRVLQLFQTTDEKTPMNAVQISQKLEEEYGMENVHRTSIYDDVRLLQSCGYPKNFSLDLYLDFLKKRINDQYADGKDFPHEIGAFLGYPIHDIYGFIYHKNEGCLLTGEWKVYAQAEQAEKIFCRYQLCRKAILKRVNEGKTLEQLFCRV